MNFLQGAQKTSLCCLSQPRNSPVKQAGSCYPKTRNEQQQKVFDTRQLGQLVDLNKVMVYTVVLQRQKKKKTWAGFPITASPATLFG